MGGGAALFLDRDHAGHASCVLGARVPLALFLFGVECVLGTAHPPFGHLVPGGAANRIAGDPGHAATIVSVPPEGLYVVHAVSTT
jgi:hypothetical protein